MTDEHPVLVPSKTPFGVLEQCAACGAYMTPTDTYGVVPGSTDAAGRLGLLVVPVCMKCVCRFHTLPRSDRTGRLHDWCEEQARRGCLADIGAAAAREHDRLKCDAIEHAAEEDLVKWDASGPTQEEWDRAKARDLEGQQR